MAPVPTMRTLEEIQAEEAREQLEHERKKRNLNFIQVGRRSLPHWQRLIRVCPAGAELMFFFAEHMNRKNLISIGYEEMVEATGLSRATLSAAVKLLATEKWIKIEKSGRKNFYEINASVFWASFGNLKQYTFSAGLNISKEPKRKGDSPNISAPEIRTRSVAVASLKKAPKNK